MNCEVWEIINKDEQYARGWVRLHNRPENVYEATRMAQYAFDVMKLKNQHEEKCDTCQGNQ